MQTIPKGYEEKVCRIGRGVVTCAFLYIDRNGFQCLKGTDVEYEVRRRLRAGIMIAKGNNCSGPPDFRESVEV